MESISALGRRQSGGVLIARQIQRDDVVAPITKLGFQEAPVPSAVPRAVDQHERGQASLLHSIINKDSSSTQDSSRG
jgi:hypothetical protein